jgi:hypothetical protein
MKRPRTSPHLSNLGLLSLLALFAGGITLILVGMNRLLYKKSDVDSAGAFYYGGFSLDRPDRDNGFRVGSNLSIQQWLAIVGAAFGCLSYGFLEAYHHLFDWWCSRQALGGSGLDYARYLNTQSRAPVMYGARGFVLFATLRHLMLGLTLAASIGYKFGIISVDSLAFYEPLEDGYLMTGHTDSILEQLQEVPTSPSADGFRPGSHTRFHYIFDGAVNDVDPFFYRLNRTDFDHDKFYSSPPPSIIMTGDISCSWMTDHNYGGGAVVSEEVGIVATMTEEQGEFHMTRDSGDWERVEIDYWDANKTAVVDYRIQGSTKIQIQWALSGAWQADDAANSSQRVERRLSYKVHYANLQVTRKFSSQNTCGVPKNKDSIRLLSVGQDPINLRPNTTSLPHTRINLAMTYYELWKSETGTFDQYQWDFEKESRHSRRLPGVMNGVSALVRVVMAGLPTAGCKTLDPDQRVVEDHCQIERLWYHDFPRVNGSIPVVPDGQRPDTPGANKIANVSRPDLKYPYYEGFLRPVTGCKRNAAIAYITSGILAIVVLIIRIWAGPPKLTSWAGQHVYLALSGAIPRDHRLETLADGYEVAPSNMGTLKISNTSLVKNASDEEDSQGDKMRLALMQSY